MLLPKKQRIALVNGPGDITSLRRDGRARICYLNFAAVLKAMGHQILYVEPNLEPLSRKQIISMVKNFEPHVVGFSCFCEGRFECIDLIRQMKPALPKTCFIAGGHQFTHYSEDALTKVREMDIIFRGEADETFPKVITNRLDPDSLKETPGLTFRSCTGEIISTPDAGAPDIRTTPVPDWTIVPGKYLSEYTVITSRGCVGKCNFCATGMRKLRFRDPESVLEEIELMMRIYGHERMDGRFNFFDDSLTLSRGHLHSLMNGMIRRQYNFRWITRARGDTLTAENVNLMKAAGCVGISTSFDAPNQKIIDACGKREKMEDIRRGIEEASRAGIRVHVAILVGNVTETMADSLEGFALFKEMEKMPNVKPFIGTLLIYPGTQLEKRARDNGSIPENFSWYSRNDMKRIFYRKHYAMVPSFSNGIVPFHMLKAMVDKVSFSSNRGNIKQILKRKNLGIFLHIRTYAKIASILSSFVKLWVRRFIKRDD
jgi:anaerobic magnesium-protoporphyrin IX monomethyl ester cyclase